MTTLRPDDLARWQLDRDRARCVARPWLLAQKLSRVGESPFAYLRGAAALYYELLARDPSLREGPEGEGWIVGDLHVENFGAYRAGRFDGATDAVVFGLNDFDEAAVAPWRFDLVRVVASLLLAGRERGLSGDTVVQLAEAFLDAWCAQVFDAAPVALTSEAVTRMVAHVEGRTRAELLDARTEVVKGRRRFARGPRYRDLDASEVRSTTRAFERFAPALDASERPSRESLEVEDVAFRVAGTGSLGGFRAAVLTRGKGDPDGQWIFDLKTQGSAAVEALVGAQSVTGARRVVTAMERCLEVRPRMVAAVEHGGASLLVRRLAPQEDKLDLARVEASQLDALARHLGAIVGRAHRRGAEKLTPRWTKSDLAEVTARAIQFVGVLHAVWLAHCVEVRRAGGQEAFSGDPR